MKKMFSLVKASMSEGMNIFKISTKKSGIFTKVILPIILTLSIMGAMASYADMIIIKLKPLNLEFVLLTLFILITSIITIVEGIYKSGSLLFNSKDDNLLLSLPIKKSTVLFIRLFKFYVFELLFNSLFLLPAMVVYAVYVKPEFNYYIVSIRGLFVFPIIPILLSCIIGTIITLLASKFKGKNLVQTLITIVFLIAVLLFSYNSEGIMLNIAKNAANINEFITKVYYPAGAYINLITNFSALKLVEFVLVHLVIFVLIIALIGKTYFNINSSVKAIKKGKSKSGYKIKTRTPIKALIKKEFLRFINSTVFVTNAGFGLVLFILGCVAISIKYNDIAADLMKVGQFELLDYLNKLLPVLLFAFIACSSFMTSITSSMISLEGKSINILKSLPVKPYTIVRSKVLTAIFVMIPCIIIGDIIMFVRFKFDLINIVFILIASIILPLISETIGIIVNLKYPKMDAKNDTEVVKQSMSSTISVFTGMSLTGAIIYLVYRAVIRGISITNTMLLFISGFAVIYLLLNILLRKMCDKSFDNISV